MNTQQLIYFLQEVPLLNNLEDNEFEQLSKVCIEKEFDKGQIIFYEEDRGTSLYIIVSGQVKIAVLSSDGREHILGMLREKEFFGEISLLDGEPRSTSVIAIDKVRVIAINREDFIRLLKNNPDITYKIIISLCKRLRWTDQHVSNLAFLSAPGRVARTILTLAEESGIKNNESIIINHKMTRQEFANIAGTSRETLTRIIMDFQDDGLLDINKNQIIIINKHKLKDRVI
jgi:CRP/FNR family cyclic AMP-dependent transcriptional regulator